MKFSFRAALKNPFGWWRTPPVTRTVMREGSVTVQGVRLHYYEWGDTGNRDVLFCVHGLTRNGRDFDRIAAALADRYRVIAIDVAGRGKSDKLSLPTLYTYPVYYQQITKMIDRLKLGPVDWLGTSMGGILGMMVAASEPKRIKRLILNDIGTIVPKESLQRILSYVGKPAHYATLIEAEAAFRYDYESFGVLPDATWAAMAEHGVWPDGRGGFVPAYDPAIAIALEGSDSADVDLTPIWNQVTQPVLLLHGLESDLFTGATAHEMAKRSNVNLVEFAGVGHAPSLMVADQIKQVREWLLTAQPKARATSTAA